ncbi:hypothetical protein SMC26_45035 [Actinomadura fulvescens]|uniref:Uncharacterized protein n=1 Tax=Actinomadura fulvescens TaxID=46160 RepID=A0ABN3QMY5_9ACTN
MRIGPRDSPQPDEPDEPASPQHASPEQAMPHPGDVHVAGYLGESPDWEPVQPRPETNPEAPPPSPPPDNHEPPQAPEPPQASEPPRPYELPVPEPRVGEAPVAEPPLPEPPTAGPPPAPPVPPSEETWAAYEPQHASETPAPPEGRGGPLAKDPPPSTTVPDLPSMPAAPAAPRPVERTWVPPTRPAPEVSMTDPADRKSVVDTFVGGFSGSAIWQATLAVLEGAFPGLGLAATLSRRADEMWRAMDSLQDGGAVKLGLPAWVDEAGMVFDLSAHLNVPDEPASKPRASWPYAGAFVIDTLDPLRYHRAVGGPLAPRDQAQARPPAGEGDDTGVVIVADLAKARVRVLDSAALWRYAGQIVVTTLYDPLVPETRVRTRRALRALQRVVLVDPRLGVGLCLQVDIVRTPRCLLAFRVDSGTPKFVRP